MKNALVQLGCGFVYHPGYGALATNRDDMPGLPLPETSASIYGAARLVGESMSEETARAIAAALDAASAPPPPAPEPAATASEEPGERYTVTMQGGSPVLLRDGATFARCFNEGDAEQIAAALRESEEGDAELSGECIMLMREHLAGVGIEATFADDAAAKAAAEIKRLRKELAAVCGKAAGLEDRLEDRGPARQREGEPSTAAHVVTKSREGGGRDEPPHYYAVLPRRETREEALADLARWEALDGQREGEPLREHPGHCPTDGCSLNRGHVEPCEGEPVAPPEGEPFRVEQLSEDYHLIAWTDKSVAKWSYRTMAEVVATTLNRLFAAWTARSAPAAPVTAAEGAEPVAWRYLGPSGKWVLTTDPDEGRYNEERHPVYAAPPPADRELRRAVEAALGRRDLDNPCFASVADSALTYIRIGDLRRLRAALDRSPAPVPAPPALDEEDTVELDAYILPVVASVRDAIRAEGQREEGDRDAELESALRGLVAALERKAGEAPR